MSFTERINYILDNQYSGDKKKLSTMTGIPYSTLVEYLSGKKKDPKLSLLSKLKNVNTLWLITGKGSMLIEEKRERQEEEKPQEAEIKPAIPLDTALATCMEDREFLKQQLTAKDQQIAALSGHIKALIGTVPHHDKTKKASTTQGSPHKPHPDPPKLASKPTK